MRVKETTELRTKDVNDIKHSITEVKLFVDDIMFKWFVIPWNFKQIPPGRSVTFMGETQDTNFDHGKTKG